MNAALNPTTLQARDTAKVFTTGRSQAVRLPKAYRFATSEVTIERQGDAIVLRPKLQSKEAFWAEMGAALKQHGGADFPIIERERTGLREPVNVDFGA